MKKIIISSVVAVIIAASIGAWFFLKPTETDKLFEQCKEKVLKQLKAPSTAVFGEYVHVPKVLSEFPVNGKNVYIEKFDVSIDSQNPFGAMIRSNWYCSIFYSENGKQIEFKAHKK